MTEQQGGTGAGQQGSRSAGNGNGHPQVMDALIEYWKDRWAAEGADGRESSFTISMRRMQELCHGVAVSKGWWERPRTPMECLMLVVTELAEAAESLRRGSSLTPCKEVPSICHLEEELADVVIRVLDLAGSYEAVYGHPLDIGRAVEEKVKYNMTRPHRHGGKLA